jgi:tRNA dimethylallyltransferase
MDPIYFILGCTACGKGSVGRELARRLRGQILSVDSMKIYRRMDIGTAKPSAEARREIVHHGLDLVEPSQGFSVAQYADAAESALTTIRAAGAIPLAVGGTSLYIQALCEGLFEGPGADEAIRAELRSRIEREGSAALHGELAAVDPASADRIHPNNARRIIRALEVYRQGGVPISELQRQWQAEGGRLRENVVRIGLRRDRADQSGRINARVGRMVEAGLVEEVRSLLDEPAGLSDQAAAAVGYAELIEHFRGEVPLDKAIEQIKINTRRLAKKQRTWMRRWADVTWFDIAADESVESVADRIQATIDFA